MKYFETEFKISGPEALIQDARDVLAAMAGDAGYETFEDTADGIKGYVQQDFYDEDALAAIIADFPFDDITIEYVTREAE